MTKYIASSVFIVAVSFVAAGIGMFAATGGGIDSGKWACTSSATYFLQNAAVIATIAFTATSLFMLWKGFPQQRKVFPYIVASTGYVILLTVIVSYGVVFCS